MVRVFEGILVESRLEADSLSLESRSGPRGLAKAINTRCYGCSPKESRVTRAPLLEHRSGKARLVRQPGTFLSINEHKSITIVIMVPRIDPPACICTIIVHSHDSLSINNISYFGRALLAKYMMPSLTLTHCEHFPPIRNQNCTPRASRERHRGPEGSPPMNTITNMTD